MGAIKREERIGGQRLLLGNCLEIMAELDGVDHVISDPPYEDELHGAIGRIRRNDGREMIDDLGFDGVNAIRPDIVKLSVELSAGWVILFTLAEGVRSWRDELQSNGAKYDTCLAWVKPDAAPRFNGQGAARGFECAVTAWAGTGYRKWNAGGKRGVYTHCINTNRYGGHPTEKPLPLMMEILKDFTNHGQTVLDPFCGSGTTLVACEKMGRKGIGIEMNEEYFELSCKRVEEAASQPDMFIAAPEPKAVQGGLF